MTALLLAALAAAAPTCPAELPASPPRTPGAVTFALQLWLDGKTPEPTAFASVLLAADNYPLSARMPWPVNKPALVENRVLCTDADGRGVVILGVTGSGFPVAARQYAVHFRADQVNATSATMSWQLVPHGGEAGAWTGPFAETLNARPGAVYTPYNSGRWTYEKGEPWVRYEVTVDPGGWLPRWVSTHDSVALVPLEMLRVLFGMEGTHARRAQ